METDGVVCVVCGGQAKPVIQFGK